MLSFISFWRAAAIVLSDLASSAYYVGGIAETAIGKSAPWFILSIMLFSYAVRALYIESCSMFVRGGVYKVVHEALGGTLAKFSVSALMFDYVLTGPISGVSAGLYFAGLINESAEFLHQPNLHVTPYFAASFAILVTCTSGAKTLSASTNRREGAAYHADHHRDGSDPNRLVSHHHVPHAEWSLPDSVSVAGDDQVRQRSAGLDPRTHRPYFYGGCNPDRPGPFSAGHER
jgi:hypothetical protein